MVRGSMVVEDGFGSGGTLIHINMHREEEEEEAPHHIFSPADSEHNDRQLQLQQQQQMERVLTPPRALSKREEQRLRKEQKRVLKEEKKREKKQKKEEKKQQRRLEKDEKKRRKEEKKALKKQSSTKSSSRHSKRKSTTKTNEEETATTTTTSTSQIPLKESIESIPPPVTDEEQIDWGRGRKGEDEEFLDSDSDVESDEGDFVGNFEFADNTEKKDFVCLSPDDIFNEHTQLIEDVAEILSVHSATATTLLKNFKWNKDSLLVAYFENPKKVLESAGLQADSLVKKESKNQKAEDEETEVCSVCYMDMDEDSFSLACNHKFCSMCWAQHIKTKINEGESLGILCLSHKCTQIVEESVIRKVIDEETHRKYVNLLLNTFVCNNDRVKWCPAPGCGKAVSGETIKSKWAECSCGYRFCFECLNEAHAPATCEHVLAWQKKMTDESETQNWISANTVDCPKCKCFIEKNGGCNHMTCRQCSYEFCWLCLRDWKGHNDFYTCNRYLKSQKKSNKKKSSKKAKTRGQKELHRQALERYLHFYSRYLNHDKSRTFEKVREEAHKKMRQLQETEATSAEVQFIAIAATKLQECRLALKYSYVVGYYLEESHPSKALFEYLQENLEKTAEQLTEALESQAEDRVKVINLTKLIETRLHNFLDWQFE